MKTFTIAYPEGTPNRAAVFHPALADNRRVEGYFYHDVSTEDDLRKVPGSALVAIHNSASAKPVKKFETHDVARRRVFPLLDAAARLQGMTVEDRLRAKARAAGRGFDETPRRDKPKTSTPVSSGGSAAKGKRLGIGKRMAELIRAGHDTTAILEKIHSEFPESRATSRDVSIVRSKVKRETGAS